jgi:hypothetical protein
MLQTAMNGADRTAGNGEMAVNGDVKTVNGRATAVNGTDKTAVNMKNSKATAVNGCGKINEDHHAPPHAKLSRDASHALKHIHHSSSKSAHPRKFPAMDRNSAQNSAYSTNGQMHDSVRPPPLPPPSEKKRTIHKNLLVKNTVVACTEDLHVSQETALYDYGKMYGRLNLDQNGSVLSLSDPSGVDVDESVCATQQGLRFAVRDAGTMQVCMRVRMYAWICMYVCMHVYMDVHEGVCVIQQGLRFAVRDAGTMHVCMYACILVA